jgi:ABC-2 type transport system ATP-binding protein
MSPSDLVIDIKNLVKNFNGKPAVKDISLQVKKGEIFGFLGPNGSGKTTTIRMICGLLTPDSGSGHCLGFDILKQSYQIKRQVGYMSQRFSLYEDLSIYENLDFIGRIYEIDNLKTRVAKSIAELGLENRSSQLAGTLSGGWKQRLALAAALLHEPKVLLLDEPTAGVDPKARRDFWDHIHYLSETGITTLVSTHYMDEAERCHRLAYIMDGALLISGTADEIITSSDLVTWEISGKHLGELTKRLRERSNAWQISVFGNNLHVSYKKGSIAEQEVESFQSPDWRWRKTVPNLEDVFVNLSTFEAKENPL